MDPSTLAAIAVLHAHAEKLGRLDGLLRIHFGGPAKEETDAASLYVQGRSTGPASITTESPGGEPDCTVFVDPTMITRLALGHIEVRFATFSERRIGSIGKASMVLQLGDAIAPKAVVHPAALDTLADMDQALRDIKTHGYAFIADALPLAQLEGLQRRTNEQAQAERELDYAVRDGGPTKPNQRFYNLISKGDEYIELLNHPIIEKLVPAVIDENFLLYSYSVNIAAPGSTSMALHCDQITLQPPIREFPLGLNIMWFLTDVTESNGGTRVYPASHKPEVAPADLYDTAGSIFASGPAGTALVFESRLWHATGPNVELSGTRPVILSFFVRSFVVGSFQKFPLLRSLM
ncbi:hypothetical protein RQP46_007807 [Phenoliferia psychrophenolica]